MRRFTGFHKAALPVAAALILILLATGPATFGGFEEPLTLLSHKVKGTQVICEVQNSSLNAESGQVWVEALVNGEVVYGFAPVTVIGKQGASITLGFPEEVEQVLTAGIITDDPSPY